MTSRQVIAKLKHVCEMRNPIWAGEWQRYSAHFEGVWAKEWKTPATVISRSQEPRSYVVEADNCRGLQTCRNGQYHQVVPEAASPVAHQECATPFPQPKVPKLVASQDLPQSPPSPRSTGHSPLFSTTLWRLTSCGREIRLPLRFRDC